MITCEEEAQAFIRDGWGNRAYEACALLVDALRAENERQNLVSRGSLANVWVRHVADSAQLLHHAPPICRNWIDVGTGAGFPGVVVGLLRPDIVLTLVEPRQKRVDWLNHVRGILSMTNCRVEQANAKDLAVAPFDVVSARAVAGLGELLAMTAHLYHADSHGLFPKGRSAATELRQLPRDMADRYAFHVKHSLTAVGARIIVCRRAKD